MRRPGSAGSISCRRRWSSPSPRASARGLAGGRRASRATRSLADARDDGGAELAFHFERRKNERADRLRVVAARLLGHVVLIRAVAVAAFAVRIAAQSNHGDGAGDVVALDELAEDAGVRAAAVLT